MTRSRILFLALVLLVAMAVPAVAHHVNEPTAPLADVHLSVLQYPHLDSRLSACDGSETVDWANIRFIVDAIPSRSPSEHFDVRVISTVDDDPNDRRSMVDWDVTWKHQNVPPHAPRFRIVQANVWDVEDGAHEYTVIVTGNESGDVFTRTCRWQVDRQES